MILTVLVDRRNFSTELSRILDALRSTSFIGLDCETQDDKRHAGLNFLMKVNEDTRKKGGNTRLYFDMRRTVITGFSVYPEGGDRAWYINLAHADVENRLTWAEAKQIIDAKPANGFWLSHNAPYELTAFGASLGEELTNIICTMQLSVTAFGDDNYDIDTFRTLPLMGGLEKMPERLLKAALMGVDLDDDEENERPRRFNREVDELIGKICAKDADGAGSYNGFVDEIAYGHGLKQLVQRFFGHQMSTFKETMGEHGHMGQLTGDEVSSYGAEDAYWVVPLFRHLMGHVAAHSPNAIGTFFEQENPMVHVYSDIWRGGMRVNLPAIDARRDVERAEYAQLLRNLRAALKNLEFPTELNPELARRQPWYSTNGVKYRNRWLAFMNAGDCDDDFEEVLRVKGAVSTAWAAGQPTVDFSVMHYMPIRVLIYDLLGGKLQFKIGKLTSDGEARGKVRETLTDPAKLAVLDAIAAMAGVETRMKLYLTPYVSLTDPETGYLYPTVNSLLNTRRLAASAPNVFALAKRGDSTYVRGFFLGDKDAA